MFGSRKYTPLPTSSNPQRRRAGGGISSWKRWALIGAAVSLVIILGYSQVPSRKGYSEWNEENDAESMYTPDLEVGGGDVDTTDYSSPPFRPETDDELDAGKDSNEEEGEQMVHIQPIDDDLNANVEENPTDAIEFVQEDDNGSDETGVENETEEVGGEAEEEAEHGSGNPHDPLDPAAEKAEEAEPDFIEPEGEVAADNSDDSLFEAESGLPTSFETDPNPSGTTACTDPHDASKPLVQYALTIDAGSTGSRIHVYKFHNCGPSPELEYETFKMLNPGLSAFASDPSAAAASLDPLLEEAKRVVPEELHSCTPVEVKATAGLRLLGTEESDAILDEVRNRLKDSFPFGVGDEHSVEIMDGKDEGVYAWITANYLAKKIGEGVESPDTLAVMDLGGASTQIVFEPRFPSETDSLLEGEHKYSLQFGGKEFTLYQHSYLGYGLMRARRSIHNLVAFTWSFGQGQLEWDSMSEDVMVPNPCLTLGSTRRVELDPPGRTAVNVTMHGGNGGFDACNRVVQLVMAKDAICEVEPCSFNGVYQPSLLDTFPRGQFLALSYFTDRIKPLLAGQKRAYAKKFSSESTLTISDLADLAKDVCAGPKVWRKRWSKGSDALAELEDRPEYCLDLTFMHALLGLGYELQPERELLVEKQIRGVELGWALGAGLALVQNAKLTCTA